MLDHNVDYVGIASLSKDEDIIVIKQTSSITVKLSPTEFNDVLDVTSQNIIVETRSKFY